MTSKPPFPPVTLETAIQKARMAENAWNGRDPQAVAMAYTEDSRWRNRSEFFSGRNAEIERCSNFFFLNDNYICN
jgi:nuclear transport factor 2 (NTF2) superfamily protein